ncbi:Sacsin DnaJ -like protein subfamily C member 29 [Takifugu flavidus]|uniref:Sacsin DnaJ-like protein subfamily C member 29 n=1 Tax=Takifugu flavidus TaxID=433684 RepID=A0A5C6PLV9_9TELE|nr:Sacsin DnaJ -like protein subfamily C member 29 [Takifugu flavidus]
MAAKRLFSIIVLTAHHVADYTQRFLPEDWKGTGSVTWNVSSTRLQKNTTLIFSKSKQNELPAGVAELVKEVGGTVVEGNEWLRHSDLDSYVLCPSPKSVLKVLRNLHYEVVRCATEADRRLLLLLKVKLLDAAEAAVLLVDCIERRAFTEEDTKRVMAWILQHGKVLFSQNVHLKRKCKELRFMQVKGGAKEASSFFDPANETFKVIFESEFFPPRSFTQTPQMLESLRDLGLINKEADVTPEHLLHAATLIEQSVVDSSHEATTRAGALLNILDRYDLLSKFSNRQLHDLQMKKWIPCPKFSSGDGSQTTCFFCPDEIRHPMYKDIVGHVMPLLGQFRDQFSTKLGLKRLPPPKKVIENLSALMSIAETMPDPDKDVDFKRQLRCIYEHMQKHKSDFVSIMNKEKRWLWSRDRFVSPQDLVLEYPQNLDLSSYIGKVPEEFLSFKDLLQEFGLRRTLSDVEIVSVLKSIQGTVKERQPPFANSSEIKVSIEILNWLWRERKRVEGDVPVPVHTDGGQYTFKPSSTVVFCDVNKTGLRELRCSREELYVTHEEITKAAAEWLNIRFLSTHILNPELVGIEQCGQSEPITTRIRNILKEYDEESDIFKELIQNAEDAGAEQCKFLVDFRAHKYSPEELIDRDMSLCQGPCLWAFNNETFKDDDWANIVRVGSASKENQVEKIGKFGLGFNTVYHVTDIPSVLSGTSLLILDPNVTHLKTHINNKSNPGIKLNLSQRELFKCFPGQFGPYERIFDCDFTQQNPYAGTLIRLPFRTEEEALTSEISQRVFCKYDINSFLECLCEDSKIHLLFLRNICTLALDRIPKDASTPPRDAEIETMLQVSKTPVTTFRIPDETHVAEQQKFEKLLMKDDVKGNGVDYHKANVVKVTSQQSGVTEVQSWLLYSCFGTQQSIKMALQENKQARFSLPIGGVAVPLQIDANTEKLALMETDFSGKAFCFLPLSIHTGLPVNINGAFAVTSNRKGLWQSGVKGDWNKALLQDPIVNAYVTALLVLKEMAETKQLEPYSYHTFWPHREKVSDNFKSLVDAFYSRICQPSSGLELFYNGELWCAMSSAIFLHESIEEDKDIGSLAVQVCKKHVRAPNHVVPLPQWLRNSFKQAGLGNDLQSRTWNWEKFYQQAVFNNLDAIDSKTRDSLVLHAIDLNIKEIDDLLVRFPCIPTKAGPLQYISKLVNPCGKVACLFELEEERLLGGTSSDFCSPKRIQRLLALGMASEDLSLEDIAEKAGTIISIWSTNRPKAYVLLRILLDLVKKHMNESPRGKDSAHWETIKMTKFLPAFCPGDTSSVTLERPMVIYNDKCSLLVNMTQPVLDHSNLNINHNDPVLTFLGVNESPRPETVLQQLQESYRQSQSTDKSVLHKIANECYNFLNQCLADPNTTGAIRQTANSFPFIFVGSMFVHVNRVAENEQFDAKPYLYVLPPNFGHFKRLWDCVGVEKRFTVEQFHTVLKELHSRYGRHTLSHSDLSVCFTILNKGIYEAEKEAVGDCLIPNEDGVLQHASELVYNDSQWMPVPSGVTLCHKNIARAAALHFGVNTTRHGTLNNCEVKNMSPFAFQFEQQEQLTVRIKNIISAYPSKKDILKELIQNADDAEATEIHFVWDKRQHDVEKTFGENWNQLQGPALCVFNNKVFSDADLKGIQRLGEGGKHSTPGKTGRYGVGFNSVYHLTDCPSILTGDELLCISDPNQIYIERHSDKASSGIGYKLNDTFKEMYADVYKSFLPDEFRLGEGTMFRLPLRRGAMANSSKLSNIEVTDLDMKELCSALSADSDGLILFLKNISKIQVHEISDKHSGKIKTIYAVQKSISQRSQERKKEFVKLRLDALKSHTAGKPQKVIYETTVTTSDKKETKWIIAEQFGSSNTSEREISDQLPQAAVAARLSIHVPRAQFLPSIVKFTGGAFCSLPLPGTTGLPVHVNANFEVDSSRRGLWKEDGPSPKSAWNKLLKEEVIAFLYADLLQYISSGISRVPFSDESFLCNAYLHFWPIVSKTVDQEWHNMILEVYKSIHKRGLRYERLFITYEAQFADFHTNSPHIHVLQKFNLYDGDYLKHKDAITSSLKTVKLIPNSQGTLETASYYFDEEVELYKTMLPQERFIPERFWAELCGENLEARKKPQELLRELGMRHVVSSDDITQFAHQLESEANGDSKLETLKRKSSLLFQVALEFVKNTDKTLLKSIAHIKFIIPKPVQKELCDYHRPFAVGRTTVSIRGSLIESDHNHQELIWSTMPIVHMPVYMSPDLKKMMTNAGAFEQPPSDRVTRTLHNICRLPCTNDTLIRTRARVLRSCYAYLQKNGFNSASLAGLPIVLVENDKKLVTAEDACIFLHESYYFRPYLYKILRHDAIFEDFFRKIGVTENATAEQYCKVLAAIHDDSEDKLELNANQKVTVRCAVAQIFNLIEKEKNSHQLSNIETLYLPATDGKLHLSCTLHYNNTVFEIRRLEDALKNKFLLLEKLSHYLGPDIYKHHQLLQLLPQKLQPKMLSGITREKVREHNMQRCELEPDCEFSGWFQNHLSSQPFRHGLICLIREQENGQITEKEVADMCTKTFGSIQIVCCRTLETALWLENEELPTTTSETDVFVKREQEDCIFYLRHNDITVPKELNSIIMTLTKEINALLENKIASNHLQVLGHLLMCDDIDDVKKALAKHEIHDSAEVESSLFSAPAAGADIPEEWYDSLDMSFLNNYEEGEYVGYWTNDKYIYAIIVEELSGIYGPHSKRFKIDIGQDEPIEVSCLDLYQFKRSKKPDARRFGTSAESSHMNLVPVKGANSASRPSTRSSPASLEEAKREIDKCLEEIWLLPEGERNKAFKRLYLRWHPDKNINCHNLATEAFKYLTNRIDELLNGRAQNAGSAHRGTNQDFRNFYGSWNQEASYHRRGRERFYGAHRHYNFWAFNRNVPQPNKKEAQRWCRQARCDLQAARKDADGSSTEWCLFKVHQAVEKSLIAAVYKRQGQHPNSSITDMAAQVSHYSDLLRGVPQIVETLKRLGVDAKKTQYPNFHPFPNIPNEQFSAENGRQALDQASQLLRVIESYVN